MLLLAVAARNRVIPAGEVDTGIPAVPIAPTNILVDVPADVPAEESKPVCDEVPGVNNTDAEGYHRKLHVVRFQASPHSDVLGRENQQEQQQEYRSIGTRGELLEHIDAAQMQDLLRDVEEFLAMRSSTQNRNTGTEPRLHGTSTFRNPGVINRGVRLSSAVGGGVIGSAPNLATERSRLRSQRLPQAVANQLLLSSGVLDTSSIAPGADMELFLPDTSVVLERGK
jgi:hypothetical protein